MIKRLIILIAVFGCLSCNRDSHESGKKIITVSIAPFKYFVNEIGGNDFKINVMVPPGSNPHIYEPYPEQIIKLRKSAAYISDGYLGFEMTWLDRFYEINRTMVKLTLGDKINPIAPHEQHEGENVEHADPHYWVSPVTAIIISGEIKNLLCRINPDQIQKYESNYAILIQKIKDTDVKARKLFKGYYGKSFMIYHPNLAYLARDYGLKEIAVEFEGKEPPPLRLKQLIDTARKENMKTVFIQREYDSKNAREIAQEIGGKICVIDPLSEDWLKATNEIINDLYNNFISESKQR